MKKLMFKFIAVFSFLALTPMLALAQRGGPVVVANNSCGQGGLIGIICKIGNLLSYIIPVLVALGVVYFVWGIIQYVIGDSEEAKKKGKDTVIFGIIGLAVIVAMWGLVNILVYTFFTERGQAPTQQDLQKLLPNSYNNINL